MSQCDVVHDDAPIPPVATGPVTEEQVCILLWVHTGAATVEAAGAAHRIVAGEAIWIPPGVTHGTWTDPGGVVLPIAVRLPDASGAAARVRVVTVPRGWEDSLVSQFDPNRYHTRSPRIGEDALLDLIVDRGLPDEKPTSGVRGPALPMPYSRGALEVAREILQSPASPRSIAELAGRQSLSVRTLQRQFRTETGLVFSEWRTRARVTLAASHLAQGRRVGWAGRSVGFATPAGFTRAFRRHLGVAPQGFVAAGAGPPRREPQADREPPGIPVRQNWEWVYDRHVLWWAYRGRITMRIGARPFRLAEGEAIWLPAGLPAAVDDVASGSIVLPLGERDGGTPLGADDLSVIPVAGWGRARLLHTVVTSCTLFQVTADQPGPVDTMFARQFHPAGASRARTTDVVAAITRALSRNPADTRPLADWAKQFRRSPAGLGQEFIARTGTTFPRWRAHLRMTLARGLLRHGDPPHEVSSVLGYASPAVFSTVFAGVHASSPRRYQARVCARMVDARQVQPA